MNNFLSKFKDIFMDENENKQEDEYFFSQLDTLETLNYKVLSNLLLKSKTENLMVHIPYLVISEKGVFILHKCNKQGKISGTEKDVNWIEEFNSKSMEFINPLMEIKYFTKIIKEIINEDTIPIETIITFPQNCDISNLNTLTRVNNIQNLLNTIVNYSCYTFLNSGDIKRLSYSLLCHSNINKENIEN